MNSTCRWLLALGESLVYGPGYGAIRSMLRHPEPLDPEWTWNRINPPGNAPRWLDAYPPALVRRWALARRMRQDHRAGIAEHYDVSNEFYKTFLDRRYMFYTCADFHQPDETLEEAQQHKADFLVDWIDPNPGERILELGCGWGAMLKRIHETTGDRDNLFGYTLSQDQVAHNAEHNHFRVEFRNFITCDYDDASFNKIYSIGAWEHVRRADLDPLLRKLRRALRPGGRMIHHFICPFSDEVTNDAVIAQLFFPGSLIPGYATQCEAFERAGFRFVRRSIHDYRPTLRAWFDNLVAAKSRAIELVGVPTYNRYLVFFAASHSYFQRGRAMLTRWHLEPV